MFPSSSEGRKTPSLLCPLNRANLNHRIEWKVVFSSIYNSGRWTKFRNQVILKGKSDLFSFFATCVQLRLMFVHLLLFILTHTACFGPIDHPQLSSFVFNETVILRLVVIAAGLLLYAMCCWHALVRFMVLSIFLSFRVCTSQEMFVFLGAASPC
jgi:hypothetical protein